MPRRRPTSWRFATAQVRVQMGILRDVADAPLIRFQIAADVLPMEIDAARRGLEEPDDHLDGRTLPCAVRAEVAENFARFDRETDVIYSRYSGVEFRELTDFQHAHLDTGVSLEVPDLCVLMRFCLGSTALGSSLLRRSRSIYLYGTAGAPHFRLGTCQFDIRRRDFFLLRGGRRSGSGAYHSPRV